MNADEEIVEISALLHDITRLSGDHKNHHISGQLEAEKILKEFNYPQNKIEKVKHCIHAHRGSKEIKRETIEADIVASADAMAHISQVSIFFYKEKKWIKEKIERSWKKLMPEAKSMMLKKYEAIKLFLNNS